MTSEQAIFRFRVTLVAFVVGLILSGVTAFPLLAEMRLLTRWFGLADAVSPAGHSGLANWLLTVRFGLEDVHVRYPWIAYGTDWLAFGHIAIAFFFVGPLARPVGSRSVLRAGVAACVAVVPLAFVCGAIRGIPVCWRFVDWAFGGVGIVPLLYCLRMLRVIEGNGGKSGERREGTPVL